MSLIDRNDQLPGFDQPLKCATRQLSGARNGGR